MGKEVTELTKRFCVCFAEWILLQCGGKRNGFQRQKTASPEKDTSELRKQNEYFVNGGLDE
jgi:hypothetical protein